MNFERLLSMSVAGGINILLLFGLTPAPLRVGVPAKPNARPTTPPMLEVEITPVVEEENIERRVPTSPSPPTSLPEKAQIVGDRSMEPADVDLPSPNSIDFDRAQLPLTPPGPLTFCPPSILTVGELDNVPAAKLRGPPIYPYEARKSGLEGTVLVDFKVDETGNVYDAVVKSSTDSAFDDAALRAVVKWKFRPGLRQGKPVRFHMSVPIQFRIGWE